jgi:hypothetical protein
MGTHAKRQLHPFEPLLGFIRWFEVLLRGREGFMAERLCYTSLQ